jgi:hypothetical protein
MNNFSPSQRRQSRPASLASSSGPSTGRSLSVSTPSADGRGTTPSFAEAEEVGEDGTLFERDDEDDFDEDDDGGDGDDGGSDVDEFVSSVDSPHMMPAPSNRVPAGSIDRVDSLIIRRNPAQALPPPPPPPVDTGLIEAIRRSSSAVGKPTYSGVLVWKDVHGGWVQHPVCVEVRVGFCNSSRFVATRGRMCDCSAVFCGHRMVSFVCTHWKVANPYQNAKRSALVCPYACSTRNLCLSGRNFTWRLRIHRWMHRSRFTVRVGLIGTRLLRHCLAVGR